MIRTVLTATLALLLPGSLLADKTKDAQIKALEDQIQQLRKQETTQLKQIDDQFKAHIAKRGEEEKQGKQENDRLAHEEKETLKRIDERYHHLTHNLDPKQVHRQLEEALGSMRQVTEVLTRGEWDFGGHRHATVLSVRAAEHQVKRALEHDTAEERARAGHDLQVAHEDMNKALDYVAHKFADGKKMPPGLADAARDLAHEIPVVDRTHHLLQAVDHEIKDYEHEKRELLKKRDAEKKKTQEEYEAKIKGLGQNAHHQQNQAADLEHKKNDEKKKVKDQVASQIKDLEKQVKQLKGK